MKFTIPEIRNFPLNLYNPVLAIGLVVLFGLLVVIAIQALLSIRRRAADHRNFDRSMIDAALSKDGLNEDQMNYLRHYLYPELRDLVASHQASRRVSFWLGFGSLLGASLSSLVTGGNLTLPGLETVQLSFLITSAGAFASVLGIFGGWGERAASTLLLARTVRLEIWQWISGSQEYDGLAPDRAWVLLTRSVEESLLREYQIEAARVLAQTAQANSQQEPKEQRQVDG